MPAQPKHIYKISHMKIEGNVLTWEDHALRISGISHVWAGPGPEQPFPVQSALILLFIALTSRSAAAAVAMLAILALCLGAWAIYCRSGKEASLLNIGLPSGAVYSFAAPDDSFGRQLSGILAGLMEGGSDAVYDISFEGTGRITLQKPPEPEPEPEPKAANVMEANVPASQNARLLGELQKLYQRYSQKNDTGSEILELINETAGQFERNDRAAIKTSLTKFVTYGLINDCNELNLDTLLQEIKSSLY